MIEPGLFPRYTDYDPQIPVYCVTPNEGRTIHRFFDTSPFSPSGRYMALLRMPQEERLPQPGEAARIVLVDLHTGEEREIAETCGWEPQLGANLNWGVDDHTLYFNDVDTRTWEPYIVRLDPLSGASRRLEGSIYRISPDGRTIVSACAKRMRRTQYGYGVVVPDDRVPRNFGWAEDDGLYATDTDTGKRKLLVSIREVFERMQPAADLSRYADGECYGFHCKFNPQGDRLMFSLRWYRTAEPDPWHQMRHGLKFWVVTMRPDGSDIRLAVGPEQWEKKGHHIHWFPDGRRLSMNLALDGDGRLYLAQVNADGTGLRKLHETIPGSGHPTVHPDGRHVLTDTYEREPASFGDGTVPLRWIDLAAGTERAVVRVNVGNPGAGRTSALRVDPHPAWSPDGRWVAFNGFVRDTRRVFIADFHRLLS